MKVDEKITLDDNSEYVLLTESIQDGSKYFLAVEVNGDKPTDHYKLFKEVKDGEDFLVEEVDDKELRTKILDDIDEHLDEIDED